MTLPVEVATAFEHAGRYLLGRQCPQGGFCFYRSDYVNEPNLADTYHAVTALTRVGATVAHADRVIGYLRDFSPSSQPRNLFHRTSTWRALDRRHSPDPDTRRRIEELTIGPAPDRESVSLGRWLERTSVILRLWRDFGGLLERFYLADIVADLVHDGGFGAGPNLWDTWQGIELLELCGASPALPGLAGFIDRLQVAALGFQATASIHPWAGSIWSGPASTAAARSVCQSGMRRTRSDSRWPARPEAADLRAPRMRCPTSC